MSYWNSRNNGAKVASVAAVAQPAPEPDTLEGRRFFERLQSRVVLALQNRNWVMLNGSASDSISTARDARLAKAAFEVLAELSDEGLSVVKKAMEAR